MEIPYYTISIYIYLTIELTWNPIETLRRPFSLTDQSTFM